MCFLELNSVLVGLCDASPTMRSTLCGLEKEEGDRNKCGGEKDAEVKCGGEEGAERVGGAGAGISLSNGGSI